jgi:cell division septal protein FtsQ
MLALVFLLGFMATQWYERQYIVDVIQVEGASWDLSKASVRSIVDTLTSKPHRAIVLADVRLALECLPYVRNASVYFSGVRELTVEIDERIPVAHVVHADGSLRYVDAAGSVLPHVTERTSHNVPVLLQRQTARIPQQRMSSVWCHCLRQDRACSTQCWYQSISEVRFDRRRGTVPDR